MVQEQLTDYISSQIKLGVSRDAIKSALVSAGWVAGDVEDTFKKVDGGSSVAGVAAANAQPAASTQGQPTVIKTTTTAVSSSAPKTSEPQMIRVSDLVSASPAAGVSAVANTSTVAKSNKDKFFDGKISGNTFQATTVGGSASGNKKGMIGAVVAVVLVLLFAGLAWYFYAGAAGLSAQVASLTSQSTSVGAQLASLQSQMDASSTGLTAQIASLTAANADLALNLSFYAAPVGGATSTTGTALPVTISGWLSGGGKAPYAITTPRGAKIFIANSVSASIASQLKPLIGDTVQLVGTYVPGSDQITVNSVTNLSPVMATTTTMAASSTMMMGSSTTASSSASSTQ